MSLARLAGASKTYRRGTAEVLALDGVDLTVSEGECVAVMGPSGSGKSTLLSLLGCLDRPSRGDYFLEGVAVAGLVVRPYRPCIEDQKCALVAVAEVTGIAEGPSPLPVRRPRERGCPT